MRAKCIRRGDGAFWPQRVELVEGLEIFHDEWVDRKKHDLPSDDTTWETPLDVKLLQAPDTLQLMQSFERRVLCELYDDQDNDRRLYR